MNNKKEKDTCESCKDFESQDDAVVTYSYGFCKVWKMMVSKDFKIEDC